MEYKFVINSPPTGPYSLNKIYAGKHWASRKKDAEYWHKLTQCTLMAHGIPKRPGDGPWRITIMYNDRLDADNHGFITKCIIDGLKGWVIVDDTRKYVKAVWQEFWEGDGILVEVTAYETKQPWLLEAFNKMCRAWKEQAEG